MYRADNVVGTHIESLNNKMGVFIVPLVNDDKAKDLLDVAAKSYEDWMCCENDSEQVAIGDYICEKLLEHGYKEDEHYNLFFNHDWD